MKVLAIINQNKVINLCSLYKSLQFSLSGINEKHSFINCAYKLKIIKKRLGRGGWDGKY